MDKQIKRKDKTLRKTLLWSIPAIIIVIVMVINMTRKKQVNVKKERLAIKEVTQGDFEDVVLFNSTIASKTSILINIIEGGAISEIFVESGEMVKEGQQLLRIYNPNAELSYLTQETAMIEQINNLRNIRVSIKNQQLNLNEQLLSIDNSYQNAKRKFNTDSTLYQRDVIARNDYETSAQEFKFQKERNTVIKTSAANEKTDRKVQLSRINTSIHNMMKSLELLRKNKENFIVKAPKDGLLTGFNPVLGENYNRGQSVGKINVLDGFKLEAKVDEFYISKLQEEISGNVNIGDHSYDIVLTKIFPEVNSGQFEVVLNFKNDSLQKDIKRGMTVKTKVFLSGNSEALVVPKGLFYQSTNGKWVFVLDSAKKAVKRTIKIGRENPFYYEILDGLKAGDQIITSSYDDFKEVEEINIE